VVTRWIATGTNTGPLFGVIPATGKAGSTTGITISRLAGGRIVEETSNWDALGMLQALGVVPRMG
jgi:predicted ester cyclase